MTLGLDLLHHASLSGRVERVAAAAVVPGATPVFSRSTEREREGESVEREWEWREKREREKGEIEKYRD
jgi:hypothetical protein